MHSALDGAQCQQCHYSCQTCSGPSHRDCFNCNGNTTMRDGLCQPCQEGQFLNIATKVCESCHSSCAECTGPTSADCTNCDDPLFIDRSRCVPCCNAATVSQNSIDDKGLDANCCKCYNSVGPCISQEHTRSIFSNIPFNNLDEPLIPETWGQLLVKKPNAVIAFICIAAVMIFVSVFAVLQITSRNNVHSRVNYKDYKKVSSSSRYESNFERMSLTEADGEDEDSLFEKT